MTNWPIGHRISNVNTPGLILTCWKFSLSTEIDNSGLSIFIEHRLHLKPPQPEPDLVSFSNYNVRNYFDTDKSLNSSYKKGNKYAPHPIP